MKDGGTIKKVPMARAVIPANQVVRSARSHCVGPGGAIAISEGPSLEVVREDGVVRAIDVTCGCGERIRIRCVYE